jgi:hypothetical protein
LEKDAALDAYRDAVASRVRAELADEIQKWEPFVPITGHGKWLSRNAVLALLTEGAPTDGP